VEGEEITNIRAQRTALGTMAMSPDGRFLVTSGDDAKINFWNWDSKKYEKTFLEHSSNVMSLVITPDSEILISGALDGIRVWNLKPQRPLYTLVGIGNPTYALAIHPNGYWLASGDHQGKVRFWNLRTGKLIDEFSPHDRGISGLIFAPDGKTLITSSYDRTVKIWHWETKALKYTLTGHTGRIRAIALNPDGQTLATASDDGVRLWNIETGNVIRFLRTHQDWVKSLAFSPDGEFLATGSFDFTIQIWQKGESVTTLDKGIKLTGEDRQEGTGNRQQRTSQNSRVYTTEP
jgi:WD40 repeat protein